LQILCRHELYLSNPDALFLKQIHLELFRYEMKIQAAARKDCLFRK